MKSHSTKILIGCFTVLIIFTLIIVGWYLYNKKTNIAALNTWQLPGISQIGVANTPGGLFGPQESGKAKTLSPDKVVEWTNYYRAQEKLPALTKNELLVQAAGTKVDDMFNKQYFEHISPDGVSPADLVLNAGYNYKETGENLALGDFKDEKDLVDAWMASPGHRANIMNADYVEIGVATGLNDYQGRNTWLAVQEFGKLAPNCTNPSRSLSATIDQKKAAYQDLADQMDALAKDAQSLADQANQQITQGNTIYASTHSKSKAQPYWDEGQNLKTQSSQKFSEAQAIDNELKDKYTEIDGLVAQYNSQVSSYNKCIKQ